MNSLVICGYDMLDPYSKAGKSGDGVNLNSVTVRYMLSQNPNMAKNVYEGIMPSYFGEGPTVEDCGTYIIPKEEGDDVNPVELATMGAPLPTVQFTGALAPQYHDNAQPTFHASAMYSGSGMGAASVPYGTPAPIPQPYMQPNQTNIYGYGMNPITPSNPNGEAMREWEEYQRTKGFKAPIPLDTDFPGPGLLSGFHKGFDPHQRLFASDSEFYDATLNGRIGLSEMIHQQQLQQYAAIWGYQPGQVIDRRENMMFPGIQEDHHVPIPSDKPVLNHMGVPQVRSVPRQLGNTAMPASALPIPGMVATNPYMQGMSMVGGMPMQQATAVPTPYMQARYNYAIANGFQSVQEMDNNDFFILKKISRAAHPEMTDEQFAEHFENNWCKRFTDIYDAEKKQKAEEMAQKKAEESKRYRIKVRITKGDEVLVDFDSTNNEANRQELARRVASATSRRFTPEQIRIANLQMQDKMNRLEYVKTFLYNDAPERKYDHDIWGYMCHGFVEATFRDLDFQDWLWWNSPKRFHVQQRVNETEFMRNCLERGMGYGIPAEYSRIASENYMFYVNEDLPTDDEDFKQYKGFIRGSYGKGPDGKPLPEGVMPLYGYITIADPKDPSRSIPFPRRFLEDLHKGYERFAAASLAKSKKAFHILTYDEFEKASGVRVMDNKEFLKEYGDFKPAAKYIDIAQRAVKEEEDLMRPPHAMSPTEDIDDFDDPTADIPLEDLQRDLEMEESQS